MCPTKPSTLLTHYREVSEDLLLHNPLAEFRVPREFLVPRPVFV